MHKKEIKVGKLKHSVEETNRFTLEYLIIVSIKILPMLAK